MTLMNNPNDAMNAVAQTKAEEFRRGWSQLLASAIGMAVGVVGLATYNHGLFAQPLARDIGLTPSYYGMGYTVSAIALTTGLLMWSRITRRLGLRTSLALSSIGLTLSFIGMATFVSSPLLYLLFSACTGFTGAATSAMTYTELVTAWFNRVRGFALGLTQVGVGLAGALSPLLIGHLVQEYGWRSGYLALGGFAFCGLVSTLVLVRMPSERTTTKAASADADAESEADLRLERRSWRFWCLLAGICGLALSLSSSLQHAVPMLESFGYTPTRAATLVGMVAAASICSRLLFGWLSDYVHAPHLMVFSCLLAGAGQFALAYGGAQFAPLFVIGVGWGFGAEVDLLGYVVSRYFSRGTLGRIYAYQYSGYIICVGLSPLIAGQIIERSGGYTAFVRLDGIIALASAAAFFLLPRYATPSDRGRSSSRYHEPSDPVRDAA